MNTTEQAIGNTLLQAFEKYGLTPAEVNAEAKLITTIGGDANLYSDGVAIKIGTRRITDPARREEVQTIAQNFINDFVTTSGIRKENGGYSINTSSHGGLEFSCNNMAVSNSREGPDRAVDDVLSSLAQMIKNKEKAHHHQQQWADSVYSR